MRFHEQIREARLELGLSQRRLADLAGVQRSVIQIVESGGNVTLETILKVLTHLPDLRLALLRQDDIVALRQSIADFHAVSGRILEALDAAAAPSFPHPTRGVRAGAGGAEKPEFSQTEIEEAREIDEEARAMLDMLKGLREDEDAS